MHLPTRTAVPPPVLHARSRTQRSRLASRHPVSCWHHLTPLGPRLLHLSQSAWAPTTSIRSTPALVWQMLWWLVAAALAQPPVLDAASTPPPRAGPLSGSSDRALRPGPPTGSFSERAPQQYRAVTLKRVFASFQRGERKGVLDWLNTGGSVDVLALYAKDGGGEVRMGLLQVGAAATNATAGASRDHSLELLEWLLDQGADVDLQTDGGWTVLMYAAKERDATMMRIFLKHAANHSLQNADGNTALMKAAALGYNDCVRVLLHAGADTELRNRQNLTARELAAGRKHEHTAHLIQLWTSPPPSAPPHGDSPSAPLHLHQLGTVTWFTLSDEKLFWCCSVVFTVLVASAMAGVCRLTTRTVRAVRTTAGPMPIVSPIRTTAPATNPTARELATTALQQATGSMDIESIRKTINKHATAMKGTDVLKEARARRDWLVDRKRKTDKQTRRLASPASDAPPPTTAPPRPAPDPAASDDAVADDPVAGPLDQARSTQAPPASSSDADAAVPLAAAAPPVVMDAPPRSPGANSEEEENIAKALALSEISKAEDDRLRASPAPPPTAATPPSPPPDSTASEDAVANDPVAGPLDQASIQASSSDADAAASLAPAAPAVPVLDAPAPSSPPANSEEEAELAEALARSLDEGEANELRRASPAYVAPPRAAALPPLPPTAFASNEADFQAPAASPSDADAAAPSAAATPAVPVDAPPLPVVALAAASAAQFDTGRPPESSIGGQTTCIICMVNPKSHAAVPCGHQTACADCAARLRCAECPICRAPIREWVQPRVA